MPPYVNGPTVFVRRLYYEIGESTVLYAASVWAKVVEIRKNRNILKRAQRAALTGVSTAYRTVSHAALCVLMDIMLIYFTAELRAENDSGNGLWHHGKMEGEVTILQKRQLYEATGSGCMFI